MKIFTEEKLFFSAAISNLLLFIAEAISFSLAIKELGANVFIRFCGISNLLLFLSAFFALLSVYFNVRKGCGTNPYSHTLRYVATCASMTTLFVFLFVLLPCEKDPKLFLTTFYDWLFYIICPLLSALSFLLFEKEESRTLKYPCVLISVAVLIIYGAVMLALNYVGLYSGPYFFLRVREEPTRTVALFLSCMTIGAAIISYLLCLGNKKIFFRGIIRG